MPIRFASEVWPRPGLAEPRSASIAGFGNTTEQKGKNCHDQDKQVQGAIVGFGDELGPPLLEALIANSVLV